MSALGPFTGPELEFLRVLAELNKDSDPHAVDALRLIEMIRARDKVIHDLTEALTVARDALIEANGECDPVGTDICPHCANAHPRTELCWWDKE
jgi:hypothetical protein